MARPHLLLLVLSAGTALAQTTCPALNFTGLQTIDLHPVPSSHTDLIRQADGSWTAFEVSDVDPAFVIGKIPHFENQIGRCLPPGLLKTASPQSGSLSSLSSLYGAYVAAPALIAPGKIFEADRASDGSSIPFHILDSQHALISSGALNLTKAPGTSVVQVGIAEATGDGKLDVVAVSRTFSGQGAPSTSVWIFPGNGDGTFGNGIQTMLPVAAPVANLTVADVDGDGVPDLLFADIMNQNLFVLVDPAAGQSAAFSGRKRDCVSLPCSPGRGGKHSHSPHPLKRAAGAFACRFPGID